MAKGCQEKVGSKALPQARKVPNPVEPLDRLTCSFWLRIKWLLTAHCKVMLNAW